MPQQAQGLKVALRGKYHIRTIKRFAPVCQTDTTELTRTTQRVVGLPSSLFAIESSVKMSVSSGKDPASLCQCSINLGDWNIPVGAESWLGYCPKEVPQSECAWVWSPRRATYLSTKWFSKLPPTGLRTMNSTHSRSDCYNKADLLNLIRIRLQPLCN